MPFRIGTKIGGFFVSATSTLFDGGNVVWCILCTLVATYLVFWHSSNVLLLFLAGYLIFLGVLPAITLGITAGLIFLFSILYMVN